jgi:hypothetical protein
MVARQVGGEGAAVRRWLEAYVAGRKPDAADAGVMLELAQRKCRRAQDAEAMADELLVVLAGDLAAEAGRKGRAMLIKTDRELVRAVMNRMGQLYADMLPNRGEIRWISERVAQALERLPPAPAQLPVDITARGELSKRLVAEAAAYLVTHERMPKDAGRIATVLWQRYGLAKGGALHGEDGEELFRAGGPGSDPNRHVEQRLTAAMLCDELLDRLTGNEALVLALTYAGKGRREIADAHGISTGTVQNRLEAALAKVRTFVDEHDVGMGTAGELMFAVQREVIVRAAPPAPTGGSR